MRAVILEARFQRFQRGALAGRLAGDFFQFLGDLRRPALHPFHCLLQAQQLHLRGVVAALRLAGLRAQRLDFTLALGMALLGLGVGGFEPRDVIVQADGVSSQPFEFTPAREDAFDRSVRAVEGDAVAGEHMALRRDHAFTGDCRLARRSRAALGVVGPVHAGQPVGERGVGRAIVAGDLAGQQFRRWRDSQHPARPTR